MLYLGAIASLPPQCGDVPIENWEWAAVDGEEGRGWTTWGEFHVLGTLDGGAFPLIEAGPPQGGGSPFDEGHEIGTLCPEPEGGWQARDPGRASEGGPRRSRRGRPVVADFAGLWVDQGGRPAGGLMLNVAFTGDLE